MEKPYLDLDINLLPEYPDHASLGNLLMLHDNLDQNININSLKGTALYNTPFKLRTTLILFFCLQGEVNLVSGTKHIVMHAGDVQFTKSGFFAQTQNMSEDTKFIAVFIDEKFYYPTLDSTKVTTLNLQLSATPICTMSDYRLRECVQLYRMMKQRVEQHSQDPLEDDIVKGYLHTMVFNVYSQYLLGKKEIEEEEEESSSKQSVRHQELFNKFMSLLQINYTKERNIKFYASELCVTPRYLSRIIHEQSGLFASDHINHFVISEAKQLIRSRKYTMQQVSEMLNFTSPSFFTRYFKKLTGFTPKQYGAL